VERGFVDCHSHVVPSGDDGAKTLEDGLALCDLAADSGTAILFATPHVWPHLLLSDEREREVRRAFERLARRARLGLRLGFELTPTPPLLREDPARYALEGTDVVLVEMPFPGPVSDCIELAEHVERAGFTPLIAHPERTEPIREDPGRAFELAERWPLQLNATSLVGYHGPEIQELAWRLLDVATVVASDGHRLARPARLDETFELVRARVGEDDALPLFDGSALGLRRSLATPTKEAVPASPAWPSNPR
jgi:protein-tyrosine phosphatase